jgi:hypothetical protein
MIIIGAGSMRQKHTAERGNPRNSTCRGSTPVVTGAFMPSIYGAAALSLACLTGFHPGLSGNFRTIRVHMYLIASHASPDQIV